MPKKFVTDHFNLDPAPITKFFVRGAGVSIAWGAYLMSQSNAVSIFKATLLFNIAIGLVYPWNAAYISKLPVKYPMHYMPEAIMAALAVAGLLAL